MLLLKIPWEEVKEKLKETNIDLTNEDLQYDPAQEEEFLNRLAKKMKRDPEEIKGLIESISSNTGKAS